MRRSTSVFATTALICGLFVANPLLANAEDLTAANLAELRTAVAAANASPEDTTITIAPGADFTLDGAAGDADPATGDLDVAGNLTIVASGGTTITGAVDRVFDVASGTLTLQGVGVIGGVAPATENGGGVRVAAGAALVTDADTEISGNTASAGGATPAATAGSGGGIATAGSVTINGSAVSGNTSSRAGGGIEVVAGGSATINEGTTMSLNNAGTAPGNGGAVHITGNGAANLTGAEVSNNEAVEGGGLWNSPAGTLTVDSSQLSGNTATGAAADQGGGGIFSEGGDVTVADSLVDGNEATGAQGSGGGIQVLAPATLVVTGSSITNNTAVRAGGGVEAGPLLATAAGAPAVTTDTTTVLTAVDLTGNTAFGGGTGAPGNGGGLHLTGEGSVAVIFSEVGVNTAVEGGGLWNSALGELAVISSTIAFNSTTVEGGGGIYNDGAAGADADENLDGSVFAFNTTIGLNTAAGPGGGVQSTGGYVELVHTTVTENSTGISGPAVLGNSIVAGNDDADLGEGALSLGGNVLGSTIPFDEEDRATGFGDRTGVTDPLLGDLAPGEGVPNGVDASPMRTYVPANTSPAVNNGAPVDNADMDEDVQDLIDSDQRGLPRPVNAVDSGSVEVQDPTAAGVGGNPGGVAAPPVAGGGGTTPPAVAVPAQPNYTG